MLIVILVILVLYLIFRCNSSSKDNTTNNPPQTPPSPPTKTKAKPTIEVKPSPIEVSKKEPEITQEPNPRYTPKPELPSVEVILQDCNSFCYSENHNPIDVYIKFPIEQSDGSIKNVPILCSYCEDCKRYYITQTAFKELTYNGSILCEISFEQNTYNSSYRKESYELSPESIIKKLGYTVSKKTGYTDYERWEILENSVEDNYVTRNWIIGHNERSIERNSNEHYMKFSISKWEKDNHHMIYYKPGRPCAQVKRLVLRKYS